MSIVVFINNIHHIILFKGIGDFIGNIYFVNVAKVNVNCGLLLPMGGTSGTDVIS